MVRQLIDYLPPVIRNVREYQAIMKDGEQKEISDLWDAIDGALNDQFISTATGNGIRRWEVVLGIQPRGTDSLAARKFRILSRLNEQLPYTISVLRNLLQTLCGEDGFEVEVKTEIYTLTVKIALTAKSNFDDVTDLLKRVISANMVIEVELKYNRHHTLHSFRHAGLTNYRQNDLRDEVIV